MQKLIQWLSLKNWAYKLAVKLIANRIVHGGNKLTTYYLRSNGWVEEGDFWVKPDVKDRDKVWILPGDNYYRVFHGKDKTFIALESAREWLELHYLLIHSDHGRYKLAGI
jgi:hypothetical protein